MLVYHRTVRSALPLIARLVKTSPLVVTIQAPVEKAEQIAQRQLERYPTIGVQNVTRTHLRKAGLPAVQLVVMPPQKGEVTMVLLSNVVPPGSREVWREALGEEPLTWRNYQLTKGKGGAMTWRFSEQVREHYRQRLARLITGRGGRPWPGQKPYLLPDVTAHQQVLKLAEHLHHYPGLSGIRSDVFDLGQYSTKLWTSTRPKAPYPVWPKMPYLRFRPPETALLHAITTQLEEEEITDEPAEIEEENDQPIEP